MAGLGYKAFTAGEVLTAANVQGYLQDQSVMSFASSAARGSAIASPWQGATSFLQDTGNVETYFGLYNAVTNPGGRDTAGWYRTTRTDGLIPMKPSTVVVDGSATIGALGTITFSGSTYIQLNGIFTDEFTNYKIIAEITSSGFTSMIGRFCKNGTPDDTVTGYYFGGSYISTSATGFNTGANSDLFYLGAGHTQGTNLEMTITNTRNTTRRAQITCSNNRDNYQLFFANCGDSSKTFDGLRIWNIGTISGKVTVYGYNA